MSEIPELPQNMPPVLHELVAYWRAVRERLGRMPSLSDIRMMDIYKIAPRLFIADRVETEDGIIRYRWRYWGTTLSRFAGADVTGKYLDETHDEKANAAAMRYYEWALEQGEPHYFCQDVRVIGSQNTYWEYERVIVPLLNKTGQPGHILGVYVSEQGHQPPMVEPESNETMSFS